MLSNKSVSLIMLLLSASVIVAILYLILTSSLLRSTSQSSLKVIYHEVKPMGPIWVFEDANLRYLSFVEPGRETQTCLDLSSPLRLVYVYQQVIAACTLTVQTPKSICIVGLGGGALPKALKSLYPEAIIDVVELNPDVVECAKHYFDFKIDKRLNVIIGDGAEYFKNLSEDYRYDIVVMDAFDATYIPPAFLTPTFVDSVYQSLNEDGVIFINTFKRSKFYAQEMELYHTVFGSLYQPEMPLTWDGNRVLMAVKGDLLSYKKTRYAAASLQSQFDAIGINIDRALGCIVRLEPLNLNSVDG